MHCSRSAEDGGLFRGESSHGTLGVVGPFTGEGSTGFGQYGLWGNNPREKLGLSQEESAECANVHRTYIRSIELGKVSCRRVVSSC